MEAARKTRTTAHGLSDKALEAFSLALRAEDQRCRNELEEARACLLEALRIRRELAKECSDVYAPEVAATLNSLGNLQYDVKDFDAALASHEEALKIRRKLAKRRPEVYGPDVALTLINLGNVQRALNKPEAAQAGFKAALETYRELAHERPDVYRQHVANTLNNLGIAQHALGDLDTALASQEEALTIWRELAEAGLEVYGPSVAMTLTNLGNVQRALNKLEAARCSHEESLEIRRALSRDQPELYQPDVAMTLNNLGTVQRDLNDLQGARATFEEALRIYHALAQARPEVYRPDVAMTLNNLGIVRRALNDLEAACVSYEEALGMYRELAQAHPGVYLQDVAMTLSNLGNAQHSLNKLEAARLSLEESLAIKCELARSRPEVYRPSVANVLNNLGSVNHDLNDLEAAQANLDEALTIRRGLAQGRPEVYRPQVAETLTNLGAVQTDLKHLEAAQASFEESLRICRELAQVRPEVYRPDVAMTLSNLGNVQSELSHREAARANFEEAVTIERELARARPEVYQPQVALTLTNLGAVQYDFRDLEAARASFEEALTIQRELAGARPEVYQPQVANLLINIGKVQIHLCELEAARDRFQDALTIYRELARSRPSVYQPKVAWTLTNLGTLQRDLMDPKAACTSLEDALRIYRALAQVRPEVYEADLAATVNNLGNVQRDLGDQEAARVSYAETLAINRRLALQRPEVHLPAVASALNNLGTVQRAFNDLDAARTSHEEALTIQRALAKGRPEVYRSDVANTLNNLGGVQSDLNDPDAARANFEEANELYHADAAVRPTAHLVQRQRCWCNLGRLLRQEAIRFGRSSYEEARLALRQACACAESYRDRFRDEGHRRQVRAQMRASYELLILTCLDLWDAAQGEAKNSDLLREAVEVAEASRARNLMDLLSDEALSPHNTPAAVVQEFQILRRRLNQARYTMEREETQDQGGGGIVGLEMGGGDGIRLNVSPTGVECRRFKQHAEPVMRLGKARERFELTQAAYKAKLADIQAYDPSFNPDQPVRPITFQEAQRLIPSDVPTAVVQFTLTCDLGLAVVISHAGPQLVRLPDCSTGQAREMAQAWFAAYYDRPVLREGAPETERQDMLCQWMRRWEKALPALLEPVARAVVQPLLAQLPTGLTRLVFCPNQWLHVFPLHACRMIDGRVLAEQHEVVYTPSLSLLHRCANRHRPKARAGVLIQDPTSDLAFARVEGESLRRRFSGWGEPLVGSRAERERILRRASRCDLLHYTGHSFFDPANALASGLVLGSKDDARLWLTLRHVFSELNLQRNRLTILNGCESGMLVPEIIDEYIGLTHGFLYAGAQCVLSTLWAVHDLSSALLIDRFYQEWSAAAKSPATALREAQRWLREDIRTGLQLRDEVLPNFLKPLKEARLKQSCLRLADAYAQNSPDSPPFASAVHWAPFMCTGLGYPLRVRAAGTAPR